MAIRIRMFYYQKLVDNMSSVFLGMRTDQIHGALVDVDAEAKKKLDAILAETIEDAGKIAGEPVIKIMCTLSQTR